MCRINPHAEIPQSPKIPNLLLLVNKFQFFTPLSRRFSHEFGQECLQGVEFGPKNLINYSKIHGITGYPVLWQGFSVCIDMTSKKKVLIIDDEEDACLLLKRYFVKKDCEVFCAYTLTEGLKQVNTVKPDIIFLDNNLPDGFGWEMSDTLLEQSPKPEIHLISAYDNSLPGELDQEVRVWQKPISFKKLDEQLSMRA